MRNSQSDFHKKLLGKVGEKLAKKYLEKNGYKIISTNFKTKIGEIDIIAKIDEIIVFVEVKTRVNDDYGFPSEAVNKDKIRKYNLVATEFLQKNNFLDQECRFDVIEVENKKINHIINAFCV
ncbi:MAG: YraN family protein [Clostridia bacterium]|nr:YraN family protein [Clostridia bacterium]